jgi:hypothetical protein
MNDEALEQQLRTLTAPELPEAWQAEILAHALREAQMNVVRRRPNTLPLFVLLRTVFARNPFSTSALTVLWLLILLFKTSTPIDPTEKEFMAHFEPNRSVYLVSLQDEIRLTEVLQDVQEQRRVQPIP